MSASADKDSDIVRRFIREIASINVHFEDLRQFWAKVLGISGPQWMIIVALQDLDQGEGVPVQAVTKMLYVDPTFVTTQSKLLEKKGFIRRKTSSVDGRVVNLSLTDKSYKQLTKLGSQQKSLNEFIFAEFDPRELEELTGKLTSIEMRLEKGPS